MTIHIRHARAVGLILAGLSAVAPGVAQAEGAPHLDWSTYYGDGLNPIDDMAAAPDGCVVAGQVADVPLLNATPGTHQETPGGGSDAFLGYFDTSGQPRWGTYYGGAADEFTGAVAIDRTRGVVYLVGVTGSDDNIATPGAHQPQRACPELPGDCEHDLFIASFDLEGQRRWGTYFGGSGTEEVTIAAAVAGTGDLYVCGYTTSMAGLTTAGSHQPDWGDDDSFPAFLAKFDVDGALKWGTYYGGGCTALAVDDARDAVYIIGTGSGEPGTPGTHQEVPASVPDAFVARFSGAGELVWGTFYGGSGHDYASSVAVDGEGGVYLLGETASYDGIASEGAHQGTFGGGLSDLFLAKLDPDGGRVWGTYLGGPGVDVPGELATPAALGAVSGEVYVAGRTDSPGLASDDALHPGLAGASDALLAKFAADGALVWATYYGGSDKDGGYRVDVAPSGRIYLVGWTRSHDGIATSAAYQGDFTGGDARFVAQFEDPRQSGGCRIGGSLPAGVLLLLGGLFALSNRRRAR